MTPSNEPSFPFQTDPLPTFAFPLLHAYDEIGNEFCGCAYLCIALNKMVWHNRPIMETLSFVLSYVESDPHTYQPSASICVMTADGKELLVTAPNLTFIELDAEIRRLHAELDAIRAQAKKNFYRAEAASAS
jgi:hypothetical protein